MKIPALLLAAALALVTVARAAEFDDLLARLHAEVEKSVTESKGIKGGSSYSTYEPEHLLTRLDAAVLRDGFDEADQVLTQLASARLSAASKELISQLQHELPTLAAERQAHFAAQVNAAVEKAAKACQTAKEEKDLDPILVELSGLKKARSDGSNSEARNRLHARVDGAARFVARWQDYLLQQARGFESTARAILRELADPATFSGNQVYPLLPRQQILARLGEETTPEESLRKVKTLDELPAALAELRKQAAGADGRRGYSSSLLDGSYQSSELFQIEKAHAAFKAGLIWPGALRRRLARSAGQRLVCGTRALPQSVAPRGTAAFPRFA